MQRLNLNKGSYRGETTSIDSVLAKCMRSAKRYGWEAERIAAAPDIEILAFKRIASATAKNIYISSGMHGDEPAGPLSVERLLDKDQWPSDVNIWLLPCLNPTGARLRTRENKDGIDLNREYHDPKTAEVIAHTRWLDKQADFYRSICVHEDWEASGFYMYGSNKAVAYEVVGAVRKVFPIETKEADGRPVEDGVVNVEYGKPLPAWPEAYYLYKKKRSENYTLEASSDYGLEDRVQALVTAVETILKMQ
jgi:protein MpaA